jgi:uncharacterized membrane-anchored protein
LSPAPSAPSRPAWLFVDYGAVKVPEITAAFWVIKVLTTGMGETASDHLVHHWGAPPAVLAGALAFAAALLWQFSLRRYSTWAYWLAVVMVSVFGTMCADVLHLGLHIPYIVSTVFFSFVVAATFLMWHRVEGTLSIHSITTRRRESFYWVAVLGTFSLGTAAGDFTARTLHLGYAGSTILFALLIAVPAVTYGVTRAHSVLWFWVAYVLTRPLGASLADYMAVSHARGGLAWGTGPVTLLWTGLIVICVAYLSISHSDQAPRRR